MKLSYSVATCSACFHASAIGETDRTITHVLYDSRKIQHPEGGLFFALSGAFRTGSDFIQDAYDKGVRMFVLPVSSRYASLLELTSDEIVSSSAETSIEEAVYRELTDATIWFVEDPLSALQELAKFHREQFKGTVVGITGSVGKTTFKEWAYHCLKDEVRVVRSPKSFNSQLGVALSLLELHDGADLALIEAGISRPDEMERLKQIIRPSLGVLTAFGSAHSENFDSEEQHLKEKMKLFAGCERVFVPAALKGKVKSDNAVFCEPSPDQRFPEGYDQLLGVLRTFVNHLVPNSTRVENALKTLPSLALRMEVFDGVNDTTIINDTYNLDKDALTEALHFQQNLAGKKPRIVVLGLAAEYRSEVSSLKELIEPFKPNRVVFVEPGEEIPWNEFHSAVVLVKAHRGRHFEREVAKGKALKHLTYVEVNLSALRHNIQFYKTHIPKGVQLLSMVKADAYGTGAVKVADFLQRNGINYLGVAFADEGVELRKNGIRLPIVVMNPDTENIAQYVDYQLEPAIYSFEQLDEFVAGLILHGATEIPVHLKFDSGMHRLGFAPEDKEQLLAVLTAQPELNVKGIYSHLADADNPVNQVFTERQIASFTEIVNWFREKSNFTFAAHLLNSEGALRFPSSAFDMVRLGISMYGYTENKELKKSLQPVVSWYSKVSQVKIVPKGDPVGYGLSFTAQNELKIAIIPVGYADGFRRSLSNGVGSVVIRGKKCPVVGRVCMDMIMVDIGDLEVNINEKVEIIGTTQTMAQFAEAMGTIPYEVLTGLSERMQRVYIEE